MYVVWRERKKPGKTVGKKTKENHLQNCAKKVPDLFLISFSVTFRVYLELLTISSQF